MCTGDRISVLQDERALERGRSWWLPSSVTTPRAAELATSKGLRWQMLCYVHFATIYGQAIPPSPSFPQMGKVEVQGGTDRHGVQRTSPSESQIFLHCLFQLFFDLQIFFQVFMMKNFQQENK